jgi:hypothetical protein
VVGSRLKQSVETCARNAEWFLPGIANFPERVKNVGKGGGLEHGSILAGTTECFKQKERKLTRFVRSSRSRDISR